MNFLPCLPEFPHIPAQFLLNPSEFFLRKSIVFPKRYCTGRAVEVETSLASLPHYMHMSRRVIVRINDHTKPAESMDGRHADILT
jgi:hypothetical protein